jgi:hypothetical protein
VEEALAEETIVADGLRCRVAWFDPPGREHDPPA